MSDKQIAQSGGILYTQLTQLTQPTAGYAECKSVAEMATVPNLLQDLQATPNHGPHARI